MEEVEPLVDKSRTELLEAVQKHAQHQRSRRLAVLFLTVVFLLGFAFLSSFRGTTGCRHAGEELTPTTTTELAATAVTPRDAATSSAAAEVLECFQVAQPVLLPGGATTSDGLTAATSQTTNSSCTMTLMDHVFAYSYGSPFVGEYTPPDCAFNRVVMNFTVVSEGRQYDRLAVMYLNDTEIWRTSTAEPVAAPGIRWVYLKDTTEYLSLWRQPQKIIFDLGNLVNSVYTGSFNTTLTATFFMADVDAGTAPPSDLVIPISARGSAGNSGSMFTLPSDNASNTVSFPQNARRAVFSVSANGQSNEEFWWSNLLQSDVLAFEETTGTMQGYSPFREVQLLIDGQLAGVQWPFPVIFTGGVVPGLHRPIVGLDDFDLREHEIDITPWLPLLCNGSAHTFTIRVAGLDDGGGSTAALTQTVGSSWYVTGKVFVWLDADADAVTTGSALVVSSPAPSIFVSQDVYADIDGVNQTLRYTVSVARSFSVQATVRSLNSSGTAAWSQALSYTNDGIVDAYGYDQVNYFDTRGSDAATVAGRQIYSTSYHFPLTCNTTYSVSDEGNITLWAALKQGLELQVAGAGVFSTGLEAFSDSSSRFDGSLLQTHLNGTASFFEWGNSQSSSGFGSTTQTLAFFGLGAAEGNVTLYARDVTAVNATVVHDDEYLASIDSADSQSTSSSTEVSAAMSLDVYPQVPLTGGTGPRVFMGRSAE